MTDDEKEEIRSIVREELGNILQSARGSIGSDSQLTTQQLLDKLILAVSNLAAATRTPSPKGRLKLK